MDKRILEEYIDACEVIRETEAEIRKLEDKKSITANETVSGSNPEFPYNAEVEEVPVCIRHQKNLET